MSTKRTANSMLDDRRLERKEKCKVVRRSYPEEWEDLKLRDWAYRVKESNDVKHFATFKAREDNSLLSIFLDLLPLTLLEEIWNYHEKSYWFYQNNGYYNALFGGKFNIEQILKWLAIEIRMIGVQNGAVESDQQSHPLRNSLTSHKTYFENIHCDSPVCGIRALELLHARFLISDFWFEKISKNFRSVLEQLGQFVVGDEKLLKYYGASGKIRLVPTKPDKIGFWFYELAVNLSPNLCYIIDIQPTDDFSGPDVSPPVATIVDRWGSIVAGNPGNNEYYVRNVDSILIFDSYYTSGASIEALEALGILYIASVKKNIFKELVDKVKHNVNKTGDWFGVFEPTKQKLFVHMWDPDENIGKKFCLTNAFMRVKNTRSSDYSIPGYDLYRLGFNACDKFNRKLHDRKMNHRYGGGQRLGEKGHDNKFIMAVLLQNTFNAYLIINNIPPNSISFKTLCHTLADSLYTKAMEYTLV